MAERTMDIDFADISVPCFPDAITGRAEFSYDEDMGTINCTAIWLYANGSLPAMVLMQSDRGHKRDVHRAIEDKLLDLYANDIDELIPEPRFDPRREYGTYWGRP